MNNLLYANFIPQRISPSPLFYLQSYLGISFTFTSCSSSFILILYTFVFFTLSFHHYSWLSWVDFITIPLIASMKLSKALLFLWFTPNSSNYPSMSHFLLSFWLYKLQIQEIWSSFIYIHLHSFNPFVRAPKVSLIALIYHLSVVFSTNSYLIPSFGTKKCQS